MNRFVIIVRRFAKLIFQGKVNHKQVSVEDFRNFRNGYNNSKFKQKILEALFIKELILLLNTGGTSAHLLLYND